jgi:hypothetical protein
MAPASSNRGRFFLGHQASKTDGGGPLLDDKPHSRCDDQNHKSCYRGANADSFERHHDALPNARLAWEIKNLPIFFVYRTCGISTGLDGRQFAPGGGPYRFWQKLATCGGIQHLLSQRILRLGVLSSSRSRRFAYRAIHAAGFGLPLVKRRF